MNEHDLVTEIRSKVDIVDIISSYLPLVQKGKNYFGVCPFHDDTNPSMSVSREKQIYRCFSCGASGNVFGFVMDYEHISFRGAVALLGEKAGVSVSKNILHKAKDKNQKFYELYELVQKFYQNNLRTNFGQTAREYLRKREITEEMIKEFGIGLSTAKRDDLVQLLTQKGYDLAMLNTFGLASQEHDLYINRIMFPLSDISGHIVGFSGRIYTEINTNKYLNTKETPIFKKGQLLYHYAESREYVRQKKFVIVMEGFMDVIRASAAGYRNTVALMGTALTNEQANLLKRLSNEIVLCFDGDAPGIHATLVNGEMFEELGIHTKVIELFDNLDPDTYILKYGAESFTGLVENAIHFKDFKIKALKKSYNLNSEEDKTNYIHHVLKEASQVEDEIRREIILKNLAIECDIRYNTLEKRLRTLLDEQEKEKEKKQEAKEIFEVTTPKKYNKYTIAPLALLYYMLEKDSVIRYYDREGIYFPEERQRFLASEVSYYYHTYGKITLADFYTYLDGKKELLTLLNEILAMNFVEDVKEQVITDYLDVVKEDHRNQEIKRLEKKMREIADPLEQSKIMEKIRMLRIGS